MQTQLPHSQLVPFDSLSVTSTDSQSQKAWYLLSLLLSLGHPTLPLDLASRCTLFPATPDLIISLCSIPNSPITLITSSSGIHVTISLIGLFAFQRFVSNVNLIDAFLTPIRTQVRGTGMLKDVVRVYFRKRKRIGFDSGEVDENCGSVCLPSKKIRNVHPKVHFQMAQGISRSIDSGPSFGSIKINNMILPPGLFSKSMGNSIIFNLRNNQQFEDEMNASIMKKEPKGIMVPYLDEDSVLLRKMLDDQAVSQEAKVDEVDLKSRIDTDATLCREDLKQITLLPAVCANANAATDAANDCPIEIAGIKCKEGELLIDSGKLKGEAANSLNSNDIAILGTPIEIDRKWMNELPPSDEERLTTHAKNQDIIPMAELSAVQKQLLKPSAKMKLSFGEAMTPPRPQAVDLYLEGSKAVRTPKGNGEVKRNLGAITITQKSKQKRDNMHIKDGTKDSVSFPDMDQVETKGLPGFESYIVEEEVGSGGYGTVYRARRKSDGTTVAIKCPHANANKHHVSNELRMLERFGGKNFVIKYEGCIKSGTSDCFVLEHVEHDRPEVLKKEINIFQLQWYGYCMFRALASLHKQGVVHRDVKPGNFLFSRKANKGYLIDFNLAMDLHQKYRATNKLKTGNDVCLNYVALPNNKSVPPTKNRRAPGAKSLDPLNKEAIKSMKTTLEPKIQKKRAVGRTKVQNDLAGWSVMKSQGADGSGITSVKDGTSTRTPSVERPREPLPCQGRKELISLLQEAMQSPNHEGSSAPASMRKRIAAPPRKVDERFIYLTPMTLHSTGIASPGACLIKNKEDGKHKKEGPCVGTKGFRAPEVLFRSPHQGPKVDIWSAGVTLLYLMIGRTPFYGDPEQNIKDIAKLRGSEDLWEIAKLHDRESSFPAELYKIESFPSATLREWSKLNTKRRDFLDIIPSSFIDLVDKCLTVNPRLRISAEDALKHEFFAPCHESLRKHRLLRQGLSFNSGTNLPSHGQRHKAMEKECL